MCCGRAGGAERVGVGIRADAHQHDPRRLQAVDVEQQRLAALVPELPGLAERRQLARELLVDDPGALAAEDGQRLRLHLPGEGDLDRHRTHGAAMLSTVAD